MYRNLLHVWPESSSLKAVNCCSNWVNKFYLWDCFLLAHPVYIVFTTTMHSKPHRQLHLRLTGTSSTEKSVPSTDTVTDSDATDLRNSMFPRFIHNWDRLKLPCTASWNTHTKTAYKPMSPSLFTARVMRMYRFCLVCVCVYPGAKNW